MPAMIGKIGGFAFNKCESLQEIVIDCEVDMIGRYLFHNCSMLKRIFLNACLPGFIDGLFKHCPLFEAVIVAQGLFNYYTAHKDWNRLGELIVEKMDTPFDVVTDGIVITWKGGKSGIYGLEILHLTTALKG
jgi:hypothetical protein